MKDEQIRAQIHQAVDAHGEHLHTDPFLAQRIMNQERTGETVVKKRLSVGLVLAIVLILLTLTALAAAGIIFAKRVPATEIADQALLQTYGITARMQSLFNRKTAEGERGSTVVTYEGRERLAYVLGKYTVVVDGQTVKSISWSHDGENTSGGLEASAWGKDQLDEILRIDPETGEPAPLLTFDPYVDRINREQGFDYLEHLEETENEGYVVVLEEEDLQAAKDRQAFSTREFIQIAKEAVGVRYHLTAQQVSSLSVDVDENSAYVLLDGTLCYRCWIFLESELTGEKTGQDGTYTVYMNLETGVVEDIQFLSEHGGGNG